MNIRENKEWWERRRRRRRLGDGEVVVSFPGFATDEITHFSLGNRRVIFSCIFFLIGFHFFILARLSEFLGLYTFPLLKNRAEEEKKKKKERKVCESEKLLKLKTAYNYNKLEEMHNQNLIARFNQTLIKDWLSDGRSLCIWTLLTNCLTNGLMRNKYILDK